MKLSIIVVLTVIGTIVMDNARPIPVEISSVSGEVVQVPTIEPKPLQEITKEITGTFKGISVAAKPTGMPAGDCETWMAQAGVTDLVNARILIQRESGCRVNADNPSSDAYGIPQALPGSKMASEGADWATNPVTQIRWMQKYVMERYGSWASAVAFHDSHNWY